MSAGKREIHQPLGSVLRRTRSLPRRWASPKQSWFRSLWETDQWTSVFVQVKKRGALRSTPDDVSDNATPVTNENLNRIVDSRVSDMPTVKEHIKACLINARSLRNKFTDLETLAAMDEYHVIGVAETWINTENRDYLAEYQLPGYTFFSCERKQRTGGGVILYVKTSLHPIVTQQDEVNNVDIVVVQIKNRSWKLNLCLIYRPPGQSAVTDDRLYEQIAEISCYTDSVIFGDLKVDSHTSVMYPYRVRSVSAISVLFPWRLFTKIRGAAVHREISVFQDGKVFG